MTFDMFSEFHDDSSEVIDYTLPDAVLRQFPQFIPAAEADALLSSIQSDVDWAEETISMYGQTHSLPRLTAWYGDPGRSYSYSGITVHPLAWTELISSLKARVEEVARTEFNSVLINRYRTGTDSVAWHSDDEPELGRNPVIASLTFGHARPFQMKHRRKPGIRESILLGHGSLLVMSGPTQHFWQHQIPKTKKTVGERINLTFRVIR